MRRGSRTSRAAVWLAAAALSSPCAARAQEAANAAVQQPRAFGHVLGDVLTQRVPLAFAGRHPRDVPLPSAGRIGIWLERRAPRIEDDAQGRAWMVIDYQIVNAAQTLTQAGLPAFELKAADGAVLRVAAWPISIGPLTPRGAFRAGDLQPLRPDRIVVPPDDPWARRRLSAMLALTAATIVCWAAWWSWRRRRDASELPFARAWQAIRVLEPRDVDANDLAWIRLHRALDEAAGQVVHAASLQALMDRAPYLEALRSRIEAFHASSRRRFFGRESEPPPFALREFARALYRAENRHR